MPGSLFPFWSSNLRLVLLFAVCLLFVGCGGGGGGGSASGASREDGGGGGGSTVQTEPVEISTSDDSASGVIGQAGGVVQTSGGARLTVPAGAFATDTSVRLSPLDATVVAPVQTVIPATGAYRVDFPEGLPRVRNKGIETDALAGTTLTLPVLNAANPQGEMYVLASRIGSEWYVLRFVRPDTPLDISVLSQDQATYAILKLDVGGLVARAAERRRAEDILGRFNYLHASYSAGSSFGTATFEFENFADAWYHVTQSRGTTAPGFLSRTGRGLIPPTWKTRFSVNTPADFEMRATSVDGTALAANVLGCLLEVIPFPFIPSDTDFVQMWASFSDGEYAAIVSIFTGVPVNSIDDVLAVVERLDDVWDVAEPPINKWLRSKGKREVAGEIPFLSAILAAKEIAERVAFMVDGHTGEASASVAGPPEFRWSCNPTDVTKGQPVQQRATGASPGGRILLYWNPPSGGTQGPQELGRADGNGTFSYTWDTNTATQSGTYTSWVRDEATGRDSNRVSITVRAPAAPLVWSSSPTRVTRGQPVQQSASGATPGGRILLYWIPPSGGTQGPQELGRADGSGNFRYTWDTNTATQSGTYQSWIRDEASGRDSNRVGITVDAPPIALTWTSSPTQVNRGEPVQQSASGATPGGRIFLHWIPPSGGVQGPLELGRADGSGNFRYTWDTNTATQSGTYTSWIRDEATGRESNRVEIRVDWPLVWTSSPSRVRKGQPVQQQATGATPGGRVFLFWIPPGGSQQGPQELGRANGSGVFQQTWNTSTATLFGTYRSWVQDESSGRVSNQIQVTIDP